MKHKGKEGGKKSIITRTNVPIFIVFSLFLFPSFVNGFDGGVTKIDNSTLFMDYDQQIRPINSVLAWAEDTPIQFWETDREVNVRYEILNNNFFTLLITNSPYGTEREYPIFYCVMNEISDYDRFNYRNNYSDCEGYNYVYKLRDIREGQLLTIKIPSLINGNNAFKWVVGKGAGGGGGLELCEDLVPSLNLQDYSLILYNGYNDTNATMTVGFQGSTSAGCTLSRVTLQWQDLLGTYRAVPTSNDTNPINCRFFNSCNFLTSSFGSYTREIRGDWTNFNVSLRTRVAGTVSGVSVVRFSSPKILELLPIPTTTEEKPNNFIVIADNPKTFKNKFLLATATTTGILLALVILFKKNEEKVEE